MKRFISLSILIVILLASILPAAHAQDPNEPKLQFPYLQPEKAIQGEFAETVTTHIYAISASAGDKVSISMTQVSEDLDPYVILLGPRGEFIASDDDSGKQALSAAITDAAIPADGLYFVIASSFIYVNTILADSAGLAEPQKYELVASGFTTPKDETVADAYFSGRLTVGDSVEGQSLPEEPVYYFTFIASEGDVVNLEMTSSEFDTMLYVFDPTGNRIGVNDDGAGMENTTDSRIEGLVLPMDGKYLIAASDVFFYNVDSYVGGTFKLSLTAE